MNKDPLNFILLITTVVIHVLNRGGSRSQLNCVCQLNCVWKSSRSSINAAQYSMKMIAAPIVPNVVNNVSYLIITNKLLCSRLYA
ncbi:unnamed protein product [Caenorhabditis nigoni]